MRTLSGRSYRGLMTELCSAPRGAVVQEQGGTEGTGGSRFVQSGRANDSGSRTGLGRYIMNRALSTNNKGRLNALLVLCRHSICLAEQNIRTKTMKPGPKITEENISQRQTFFLFREIRYKRREASLWENEENERKNVSTFEPCLRDISSIWNSVDLWSSVEWLQATSCAADFFHRPVCVTGLGCMHTSSFVWVDFCDIANYQYTMLATVYGIDTKLDSHGDYSDLIRNIISFCINEGAWAWKLRAGFAPSPNEDVVK